MELTNTRWGLYLVLNYFERGSKEAKVKLIKVDPNKNISYQTHKQRGEIWSVISGSGTFVQDGKFYEISQGDTMRIPIGSKHAVKAGKDGLEFIEIQFGDACVEEDIERIYMDWKTIEWFAGQEEDNG